MRVAATRRARADGARAGLPRGHAAARGLRPRPDGDRVRLAPRPAAGRHLRVAARRRPRLHAGRRALQQRPPHLRERALAGRAARGAGGGVARGGGADRAGRALDGRARGAQRLPLRGARTTRAGPAGCGTWSRSARRTWARRSSSRCTWRAPRSARCPRPSLRRGPAPPQRRHPRPAPGLAGGRGLARPRSRRPARRRRAGGAAARGRDALLRGRDAHPQPPASGRRVLGDTLVLEPAPPDAGATGSSRSRPSMGCTSAAPTTWRCSTIQRCTSGCARGCASRLPPRPRHPDALEGQRRLRPRQQRRVLLVLRHGDQRVADPEGGLDIHRGR